MASKRPKTLIPAHPPPHVPLCASLPPEVWINVFRYHTDYTHLWLTCRAVSSSLRACVEYAFAEHFLDSVRIDWQLERYNLGGKSRRPELPVTFDRRRLQRVDAEAIGPKHNAKDMAIFRDKRPKSEVTAASATGKKARQEYDRVMKRWEENVRGYKPEMPNYTISIQGIVNDTPLPGLTIDVDKREVSFEWKPMLQLFYRESLRLRTLKAQYQRDTALKIRANNRKLAKGEKLMPADYPLSWAAAEVELRKEIRRARLREHYADNEQMVWAIDSLEHFENHGAASGGAKAFRLNPDLPGAGLGEKWFGSVNLVQELYLDEWSCMHRIDTKVEHLRSSE
ncbi:hypothetical protein NX059_003053 [Plenodomus lindquistii]|nr:hypothetical protein NX059_003053 [Plenodomus lindquistii]